MEERTRVDPLSARQETVSVGCSRPAREAGVTLIESLVAVTLLSVLAVTMFSLYSTGLAAAKLVQGLDEAALLAQQRLEQIKATAGCNCGALGQVREPVDPVHFPGYAWEVDTLEQAPGLQLVTVHVYWRHLGRERQVSLVTYIATRTEGP